MSNTSFGVATHKLAGQQVRPTQHAPETYHQITLHQKCKFTAVDRVAQIIEKHTTNITKYIVRSQTELHITVQVQIKHKRKAELFLTLAIPAVTLSDSVIDGDSHTDNVLYSIMLGE